MATTSSSSSSSSSSVVTPQKYGVFLSFRGKDTRNTFVDHLYEALRQQGILTFIDSEDFQKGGKISEIVDEIQKSNISVVILSANYADSPWCLEELAKIMECRDKGQQVVPVFYHVDPSHVENQTGTYKQAFKDYEADTKNTAETLQRWRKALFEVANLSGRVVIDNSSEAQAIKDIVKDISNILKPLYPNDFPDLVGIQPRIQEVESLLGIAETDIRVIGICGTGGLGKTTLADALFKTNNSNFDGSSFLKNVRERSKGPGLKQIEEDLVLDIFNGKKYGSTDKMLGQLPHKKILVVLDDVDNFQQFKEIIGNRQLHPGSRIIITSRDKQVLRNVDNHVKKCWNVKKYWNVESHVQKYWNVGSHVKIYEIEPLGEKESLQLFMLNALEENQQKWHSELSKEFVNYVKGNPLGLTILGQHLQGKDKQEWESALCRAKKGLHEELTKVLRISYDGLHPDDREMFLDIACFFNRYPTSEVRRILQAYYGSSVKVGLKNLEDKSLVTMSGPCVDMHDLLEEMGKEVVREESRKEPGKRSRLWNHEEICQVLTKNTGSEAVEGILMVNYQASLKLAPTVFAKMHSLKLLEFSPGYNVGGLGLPEGLEFLPKDELRQFKWPGYPLRSLPSDFFPEKLATLDLSSSEVEQLWSGVGKFPNLHEINLSNSNIKRLWTGVQDMPNFKIMDLSWCCDLIELPDLSKAPNLEKLYCFECENLEEVSPSISHLSNLEKLNFVGCFKIGSFPSTVNAMRLKVLSLSHCIKVEMFPEVSRNIEKLNLHGAGIKEIPSERFRELSCLKKINLGRNKLLGSLPDSLGCLSSLKKLDVSHSSIESIPTSIIQLSHLQKLFIIGCDRLQCLPDLPSSVCLLWADGCKSLQHTHFGVSESEVLEREVLERLKWLKFDVLDVRELRNDIHMLGFRFTDCIMLDASGRKNIIAFAQQSITTVVAPTVNRFVKSVEDQNYDNWERILCRFIVPGNEMPDWIQHQSTEGSSITIDFQPLNLLGFIFCAVFDFRRFGGEGLVTDRVEILFNVRLNSNHCGSRRESTLSDTMRLNEEGSKHVLLCYAAYVPNEADSQYSELSATVQVKRRRRYQCPGRVVKWGLSLIYKDGGDDESINDKEKNITYESNSDDEEEQTNYTSAGREYFHF